MIIIRPDDVEEGTDFSRASTATYFDADGILQTAAVDEPRFDHDPATGKLLGFLEEDSRTNLVLHSEAFDNAAWVKTNITVTADTTVAVDGATTADTVSSSASNATDEIHQDASSFSAGSEYFLSCYLKKATSDLTRAYYREDGVADDFVDIDWTTSPASISGGSTLSPLLIDSGDGWYRLSIGRVSNAGSTFVRLGVQPDRNATGGDVILWGAQIEQGSDSSSYIPTTTAAVTRAADVYDKFASNVPEDDYPVWDSQTTYADGDRVIFGIEAWESLVGSNTDQPDEGAAKETPTWLRLGYINRWRMFRDGRDSKTRQLDTVSTVVTNDTVTNGLALLGMEGIEAEVTMTDPTEGIVFNKLLTITDIGVGNWYDFYYEPYGLSEDQVILDLPPYIGADITVEIRAAIASDEAAIGRYVIGYVRELGTTDHGTNIRWLDSSIRERDEFGNLRIVPRRRVRLVDYAVSIETNLVDYVNNELAMLANEPTVFIGSEQFGSTIVFGFYRDFDIIISNPALSDASVQVEGF